MANNKASQDKAADKVFDVSKPGSSAASASSRPLIVGHKPMLQDPMVKKVAVDELDENKGAKMEQPFEDDLPSGSPTTPVNRSDGQNDKKVSAPSESKLSIKPLGRGNDNKTESKDKSNDSTKVPVKVNNTADNLSAAAITSQAVDSKPASPPKVVQDEIDKFAIEPKTSVTSETKPAAEAKKKTEKTDTEDSVKKVEAEKLIESKQYHVPIGQKTGKKRSSRRLITWALLALLLAGLLFYLMVDVGLIKANIKLPFEFFKDSNVSTTTPVVTAPTNSTANSTEMNETNTESSKSGYLLYTNKTYGVSFNYPKSWGKAIHATKTNNEKGYSIEFARNDGKVIAGAVSRDFEIGADGSCYVVLGLGVADKDFNADSIKLTSNPTTTRQSDYATTSKLLFKTNDSYATESFEAGKRDGLGLCLGAYMNGAKKFASNAKLPGVAFFFGDNKQQANSIPLAQLDAYLANPNAFISQVDRNGFVEMVKSAKSI